MKTIAILLLCLVPLAGHCSSAIYGFVNDDGVYHFTNIKPTRNDYRVIINDKNRSFSSVNASYNNNYDKLILHHSNLNGLDPSLVKAVMRAESNFNPHAVSPKGAQGLMQLMPDTARLMRVSNPFDPEENIRGGTKYLKYLDEMFQGDVELVLAAYNAGPTRVKEHRMNIPPIEETKTFIKQVKYYYNKLKTPP